MQMTATACNWCVQASEQELGPRRARGSKSNLLHGVARQSSAVNLTTFSRDSDFKRLMEEVGFPCTLRRQFCRNPFILACILSSFGLP